jgi:hypothetical protein
MIMRDDELREHIEELFTNESEIDGVSYPMSLVNSVIDVIKSRDEHAVRVISVLHSDIAYAIGYTKGLGVPCDYLERRYPELTNDKTIKEEATNERE